MLQMVTVINMYVVIVLDWGSVSPTLKTVPISKIVKGHMGQTPHQRLRKSNQNIMRQSITELTKAELQPLLIPLMG